MALDTGFETQCGFSFALMGHSDGTVRRHWAMHVRVIVPVPCARTYLWHLSHLAEQVLRRSHGGLARRRGKPSWVHGETKRKGGRTAGLDGRHHGQTGERADIGMGRAGGRPGARRWTFWAAKQTPPRRGWDGRAAGRAPGAGLSGQ